MTAAPAIDELMTRLGFFTHFRQGLFKTSASIGEGMVSLSLGRKEIDDDLLGDIEARLLTVNIDVETTILAVQDLTKHVACKELVDGGVLYKVLQEELVSPLCPVERPLQINVACESYVILVIRVSDVGKTAIIGKLVKKL